MSFAVPANSGQAADALIRRLALFTWLGNGSTEGLYTVLKYTDAGWSVGRLER